MNNKNIDVSTVNPFLGAAFDVFKQVFGCDLKKGQISLKPNPTAEYEIAIIIGISGKEYTGVVVFSMKIYTAKKMVMNLDPDNKINEKDESFSDALGEIANMITGNAMSDFSKKGMNLTITTPSVVIGDAFEVNLLDQTTLSTDMTSPFGVMEINVAIKKI